MTGRERIRRAFEHREADRVPVDFGGCAQTTLHVGVIARLREHYGLERRPVKVEEPYTMMGRMDEDLKQAMGVDVDAVPTLYSFFGITRDGWKEHRLEDGLEVLVPGGFNLTRDAEGNSYMHPQGDTSAPPAPRCRRAAGTSTPSSASTPSTTRRCASRTTWRSSPRSVPRSWTSWPRSSRSSGRPAGPPSGWCPARGWGISPACPPPG